MGRPDLLFAVNALAREVTRWTMACDKRLHRLISYLHHTKSWIQSAFVGNRPEECWIAQFCDASFGGDLKDSKSTSGSYLCLVGSHTFVPISWMCKKQGAVSHSSSEAEIIALDAALRMEGIPALALWEQVIEVFTGKKDSAPTQVEQAPWQTGGDSCHRQLLKILSEVDYVPPSLPKSRGVAKLVVFEDNDAVIKMVVKGRSPQMRHVSRTHRVDLDWLFERMREDPGLSIKYVGTKEQIADIFTKASFTAMQWNNLCELAQIGKPKVPLCKTGGDLCGKSIVSSQ